MVFNDDNTIQCVANIIKALRPAQLSIKMGLLYKELNSVIKMEIRVI